MTNSQTSSIRERFARIAAVANGGAYNRISAMDTLCEIERLWHEAEDIMLTYDDQPPEAATRVTTGGNSEPHYFTGVKW